MACIIIVDPLQYIHIEEKKKEFNFLLKQLCLLHDENAIAII